MSNAENDRDASETSLSPLLYRAILAAAIVYLALFVFNAVTRTGRFSPDSMSYVNVAQNFSAGKGLTQPTVGFNQQSFSIDDKAPIPFTEQAPLYPLMIAIVSRLGISPARSALLLSAIANGALLFFVYRLTMSIYDKSIALLATALLLFYYPTRWIAGWAWSEPIALDLLFLFLWLLISARSENNRLHIVLAGLVGGLAFATRYASAPLFIVGLFYLLLNLEPWKRKLADIIGYAISFAVPAGLVFAHNILAAGSLLGSVHPPRTGLRQNFVKVIETTFGAYLDVLSAEWQMGLLGLSIFICGLALLVRGQLRHVLHDLFVSRGRFLLLLWTSCYLAFLIGQRGWSYFDVDVRTIAPAGVVLVVMWTALLTKATRLRANHVGFIALILFTCAIVRETSAAVKTPVRDFQATIRRSERLSWIEKNVSAKDLVIGDDVVDVPFLFNRAATLSFSPFPYTDYPTYEKIMAYVQKHCPDYEHVYVVLKSNSASEEDWRLFFGDFFADLSFGHTSLYPGIAVVQRLNDGSVFQIPCRGSDDAR